MAPYVAVIGAGRASPEEAEAAEEVGRALGAAGAVLVCGGLGGVMEAACRRAVGAGGTTVGILPGTRREDGNPWLDVAIPTGLGEARNALVVRAADAVVAVGAGGGPCRRSPWLGRRVCRWSASGRGGLPGRDGG